MPELPEVETVRRSLTAHVVGRRIDAVTVRERRLREPVSTRRLRRLVGGRRILAVRRRAKYLLIDLEGDSVLLLHLGMSGRISVQPRGQALEKHDHLLLDLDDGRQLRFNDARRFGMALAFPAAEEALHPRLAHLGVEPLGSELDADALHAATRKRKAPVKSYIMDASRIVGVGNIYASEALYRAGIHPTRAVGRLSAQRWHSLTAAIRSTLADAIEQGGTTLRDFADVDGEVGYFAVRLSVYGREGEPCLRCRRPIRRIVQTSRSTFYCPGCQR